jgi:hypothetical protein
MRAILALLASVMALAPTVVYGQVPLPGFVIEFEPEPINSPAFAVRATLPGQPGYLETVNYIDTGMRYIDPESRFFISAAGEMCFRTRPRYPTIYYDIYYRNWCVYPQSVERVEAGVGLTANEVRLWCMHVYPECVHTFNEIASSVSAPTIDYRQEREALENLIYLMGGIVRPSRPFDSITR